MTEVGDHTKQALLELYKEKKSLADRYRAIMGDNCPDVSKLEKEVLDMGGALIVTADHGNADDMAERNKKTGVISRDENGIIIPKTSHSLNVVPMHLLVNNEDRARFVLDQTQGASLANLAATSLNLLGFEAPSDYYPSLLNRNDKTK